MGTLGWHNPAPLEVGGGSTIVERHYRALREAPGRGGVADDEDESLEAQWRQRKAVAMASYDADAERAALQKLPGKTIDFIPYYERALLIIPPADATEEDRRQVVRERWTAEPDGLLNAIEADLQEIDSRFSFIALDHDVTDTTLAGKVLQEHTGLTASPAFHVTGVFTSSILPNYAGDYVLPVLYALGGGGVTPTTVEAARIVEARAVLHARLPAWMSYNIIIEADGFTLDEDPLDLTGFGS